MKYLVTRNNKVIFPKIGSTDFETARLFCSASNSFANDNEELSEVVEVQDECHCQ
ncbi:MAG: hypothetical protein ACRDBG_06490 [Waterburya sp.]